jgi:glycine cleavage system H protein
VSNIPKDYRYTQDHEWAYLEDTGTIRVGITDYAQDQLGAIVFVDLPKEGAEFGKEDSFGVVESTKSVSDLLAPVSGTVAESNTSAAESPELLNEDPYAEGWLIRIQPSDPAEYASLMSAAEYEAYIGELEG